MNLARQFHFAAMLVGIPLAVLAQGAQGLDESCMRHWNEVAERCGNESEVATKQCWRQRLTTDCFDKVAAGTGTKDTSCKQQLQQAAMPCTEASLAVGKQCMFQNISQKCRDRFSGK